MASASAHMESASTFGSLIPVPKRIDSRSTPRTDRRSSDGGCHRHSVLSHSKRLVLAGLDPPTTAGRWTEPHDNETRHQTRDRADDQIHGHDGGSFNANSVSTDRASMRCSSKVNVPCHFGIDVPRTPFFNANSATTCVGCCSRTLVGAGASRRAERPSPRPRVPVVDCALCLQ